VRIGEIRAGQATRPRPSEGECAPVQAGFRPCLPRFGPPPPESAARASLAATPPSTRSSTPSAGMVTGAAGMHAISAARRRGANQVDQGIGAGHRRHSASRWHEIPQVCVSGYLRHRYGADFGGFLPGRGLAPVRWCV